MNELKRKYRMLGPVGLSILLAFAGVTACGDDPDNQGGEIQEKDVPNILTDFTELQFVEVALNDEDVQTLVIFNSGVGDLNITKISLVEETRDDPGKEEFRKGDNWVNSARLAQDEQLEISVAYMPKDKVPDEGYILIESNDPEDGKLRIPLITPNLAPRIDSPKSIVFPRVPPVTEDTRDKFWKDSTVQNVGQAPLEIKDVLVSPRDSFFHVTFPESEDTGSWPSKLEPGDSFPIRVFFNPENELPANADLIFFTNDPSSPEYVVSLEGNSGAPCIRLSEEEKIDFGQGSIGFANNKTIAIENCSPTSDLEVSEISVCTEDADGNCDPNGDIYTLAEDTLPGDLPDDVAVIGPQDTASFVLTYTPVDEVVTDGQLTVASSDPGKGTLRVPITGKGTNNQCPTAIAEARLAGTDRYQTDINTIPLKTIELRASNSVDPDGEIARYEWNIIKRPTNSTARLDPNNTAAEPSLFLDLAGDYQLELVVYDEQGLASCGDQAIVNIRATPDEDIHVQLVWQTPGDQNQTDEYGTDLDLHFLHPNGNWNTRPYDIFWNNPTNEWGTLGPDDDPSLDIDDTDGAGPENINLSQPESGQTYAVGVYYYADNGYGPSYATVRVYIQGQPRFEQRDKYLEVAGDFWYVATISWPSEQIFARDDLQEGFPNQ